MATAKKLPSGSWRCQVFSHYENVTNPDGTTKKKRIYKSFTCDEPGQKGKRKCEKAAAEWAAAKEIFLSKQEELIFSDALKQYIESKEPVLSPATIRGYRTIERTIIKRYSEFAKKNIYDITDSDMQQLINRISENCTPKTVRNYHAIVSSVLKENNVFLDHTVTLPKKVSPNLYIPSDEEISKIVQNTRDTELELPVMLAAFCTMRRGEICGLSMDDISDNIIHVHHSLVLGDDDKWHLKAPKTNSSDRYIKVPDFVSERIRKKGYITTLTPTNISYTFRKLLEHLDIPHFRFHDLRHYSASVQHALGIPDAYIMQRGGWSSDTVLKSVYRHAMSDRQKEMSKIANDHFNKLCNTKMQHETKKCR